MRKPLKARRMNPKGKKTVRKKGIKPGSSKESRNRGGLTVEWKVLIATFLASSIFLFIASLQIVSHARGCKTQQCLMEDITTFTMTSFFLLCLNAAVLAGFLGVFYWRRYQEIKKKYAKDKQKERRRRNSQGRETLK